MSRKWEVTFTGTVRKFPGRGGWVYVAVPQKLTYYLKNKRHTWGMYPIRAHVGNTTWRTKLMMKKGGDFFVALKAMVRNQEKIIIGNEVSVFFESE